MADAQSGEQLRDEILACVERTLEEPRARIEFRRAFRFTWPEQRHGPRRRGGVLRPVGRLAKIAAKRAGKAAWDHWAGDHDLGHLTGEGIIEPAARRHMIDFGSYAEIYMDGKRWGGRSGRPIATLAPWPPDRQIDLWWLLDGLRGAADTTLEGEESLHGVPCRRVAVRVDLEEASAVAPTGLHVPSVERVEDLRALPLTVWTDGRHVRRVRFRDGAPTASSTMTLDLLDFGPSADGLDWERLPTFRSPEEAAYVSGEREWPRSERLLARLFGGRG